MTNFVHLHDRLCYRLRRETRTTYALVRRDLTASMFPALLLIGSASWAHGAPKLGESLAKGFLYFLCYIYVFCLANQIVGVEEDRINKSDRPLPSGFWTMQQARRRLLFGVVMFLTCGLIVGGTPLLVWATSWVAILTLYNFGGWDRHWVLKNLGFITLGTFVLLGAARQIAGSTAPMTWIVSIAVAFGFTLNLQDFRDVAGDRAQGRRTLPIAIGDLPARIAVALSLLALPALGFGVLVVDEPGFWALTSGCAALNILTAWRLFTYRTRDSDHLTYMLHTLWFCAMSGAAGAAGAVASAS